MALFESDRMQPTSSHSGSILVVGIQWPPETFLARLIKGLLEAGFSITIASKGKPDASWLEHPRFFWLNTPSWDDSFVRRLYGLIRMLVRARVFKPASIRWLADSTKSVETHKQRIKALYQLLPFAGQDWDVVYFPWNFAAIGYWPVFDCAKASIVSARGSQVNIAPNNPRRVAMQEGLRRTFERATAVHCVSEDILKSAVRWGLQREKAQVIRPAVDPVFFCPGKSAGAGSTPFRIVMVGNLNWVKGHEYALLALRRLVDQGIAVQLTIIGDGQDRQRILYTIYDLGLESHVQLVGSLTSKAVRNALQQADAFLLASLSEGISNAVLEAMACGVPVVTTDCGGMREAINDGKEGFIVPLRDPGAMSEALARLVREPDLREKMGQAARRRILACFTLKKQVEEFHALLKKTMEKNDDDWL